MEIRKYLAEMMGTFVLVFMGCGSAVLAGSAIGNVGISFAFGVAVLMMAYAIGHISGCHINPAVTIGAFVAGKINVKDTIIYIIMQCIGAVIGSAVLFIIALGNTGYSLTVNGLGQNLVNSNYTLLAGLMAEIVLTFIFLIVILGSTDERAPANLAGVAIGLSLFIIHLIGIPITGTSVNPARSLGPAVFVLGDALIQLWIFWVGPLVGAVIAGLVWRFLFEKKE